MATHSLSRRDFGLGLGGLAVAGLLAACGSGSSGGATAASSGPWTWTDSRNKTVKLDAAPQRIVVSQWQLPAFWAAGIKPVGVFTFMPWKEITGYAEAGIPEGSVEVLSTTYGEVNLEKLAALTPDLIVCDSYEGQDTLWGFADTAMQAKAEAVAPTVGVKGDGPALAGIETRQELAASLGADLQAAPLVAAKAQFEKASAALKALAPQKSGLTVAFAGPSTDGLYLAPADEYADLEYLKGLGFDVYDLGALKGKLDKYNTLSWENAVDLDADVLLYDDRTTEADLADVAVWKRVPAVAAGQSAPAWRFALPYEYGAFARSLTAMTPALTAAKPL